MSILSTPWLMALCCAPFVVVAAALVLFLSSKKPHYRWLSHQWGRAALVLALIGSIQGLVLGPLPGLGLAESLWRATERAARVFGAALAAVSLALAGAYAWQLLRRADDYSARSGFRIGISLALTGLVAQLLSRNPSALRLGAVILIGAASLLAVEWLMRWYAREPAWLLGACAFVLPATAAAIVVLGGGLPALRVALVVVLATVATVVLVHFTSRRARVSSSTARPSQTQPLR